MLIFYLHTCINSLGTLNNKFNENHIQKIGGLISLIEKEKLALINGITNCAYWVFRLLQIALQMFFFYNLID